ncbi:sulfite exporter TauE/SafE family protein [Paenibacillus sp. JX-17]|uniref:Probable membrane transporter protein n=1 Tax=Paenibacillus lacisoli TaxID=3064525 RepID=A0ABT9CFX9_9BACL|nr:sulfite exporter TauE/SafE family protein [Paenibacillus sp. JX-17]MDO7908181.1 sulfite exporter TauE/SafE family protein [Paenibacillus sp. JX-17]
MHDVFLILVGLFASLCGTVVGLGGGFIMVPFLALVYPMPVYQIVGTSMAVLAISSISSTAAFIKQKRIDYKSGVAFALAMVPGSVLGAITSSGISSRGFFIALGIFLFLMALFLLMKPKEGAKGGLLRPTVTRTLVDAAGQRFTYSFNIQTGIGIGLIVGFISSLFGIGGGSIMVPTMVMLLSFPPHIAVATSALSILISALAGTISHAWLGHIDWIKVLWLAIGALIGSQLGAKVASRLPAKIILRALSVCLIIVAVRLMFKG